MAEVNRMQKPDCASRPVVLKVLDSTVTRRAFFSSNRFFNCQRCKRQSGGLTTELFAIGDV